jgi:two-component system chemotaxis sensor kinase CheA
MDEFVEQFLIECRELVEQGTADLLALEENPTDRERLDGAFRAVHTLKGAAGIVDFTAMGTALHAAEDVLSAVRSGAQPVSARLIGDCLTCLDQVIQWLDDMRDSGEPPPGSEAQADAIVKLFTLGATVETAPPSPVKLPSAGVAGMARSLIEAQIALLSERELEGLAGRSAAAVQVSANVLRAIGEDDQARQVESHTSHSAVTAVLQGFLSGLNEAPTEPALRPTQEAARILRVDVDRIDALVKIVGELTVVKNAVGHLAGEAQSRPDAQAVAAALRDQHNQFDRLIRELHRSVLAIRVLPLAQVFQRFPRLLREMAAGAAKPARLTLEGETTEADKVVVESLFEPLLHVLRNAVDHGVEAPAKRLAAGKPETATITLRGLREGEHVVIEVTDDGGGIDVSRVRQVAIERGVVTPEAIASMEDEAVQDLIFAPGFSTAAEVSALSGRGVGMDAVRTAVERLGGRVKIDSRAGVGTTVRFVMPFSVMISRVMTVQAGDQMFGVPLDVVVETVRVPRDRIMPVGAAWAFVLRNRTLPVIDLAGSLGRRHARLSEDEANIVIVAVNGQLSGLEVDRFGERMDVMLKPMDGLLSGMPGVAGTTVLGDGRVLIVLDISELLR